MEMRDDSGQVEWDELVYSIRQQDCILMLGPEAVVDSASNANKSLAESFCEELKGRLPDERSHLDALNPSQVAQIFKHREGRASLRRVADEFYTAYMDKTTEALRELAALPFRMVIDTTPVRYMENAFLAAGKTPIPRWYHMKVVDQEPWEEFDADHPLVYHLYGSLRKVESLVLAENDYVDLLVSVISENPPIPTRVVNEFRLSERSDRDSSLLFVGFGLRHLSLRILLHVLNQGNPAGKSYALEHFSDSGVLDPETAKLFIQQGQRIVFLDLHPAEFAAQLRARYESKYGLASEPAHPIERRSARAKVFLSYCREDRTLANNLRSSLQAQNIEVWMDTEDIEAGDDYDPKIEEAIDREVDCFLLLHTKTFVDTREGYVNTELAWAEKRAARIRGAFVIPVLMDDAELLWRLSKKHAVNLNTGGNAEFNKLVGAIMRREQENRKALND